MMALKESCGLRLPSSPGWKCQSPPFKVLSSQLKQCRARPQPNGGPPVHLLDRSMSGKASLELTVVWMQGTVVEIKMSEDNNPSVQLLDETGPFSVIGINNIPKGKSCLSKGKYVMVMGIVLSCNPEPVLRAVKMTDLSDNPIHRSMWKLEVEDLQQNI
uniref:RecQ mediated genome instability 2 n=1 Tax=Latimeria chalumnae TaxID=7897 RepID=H3ACH8_LATCH